MKWVLAYLSNKINNKLNLIRVHIFIYSESFYTKRFGIVIQLLKELYEHFFKRFVFKNVYIFIIYNFLYQDCCFVLFNFMIYYIILLFREILAPRGYIFILLLVFHELPMFLIFIHFIIIIKMVVRNYQPDSGYQFNSIKKVRNSFINKKNLQYLFLLQDRKNLFQVDFIPFIFKF